MRLTREAFVTIVQGLKILAETPSDNARLEYAITKNLKLTQDEWDSIVSAEKLVFTDKVIEYDTKVKELSKTATNENLSIKQAELFNLEDEYEEVLKIFKEKLEDHKKFMKEEIEQDFYLISLSWLDKAPPGSISKIFDIIDEEK